MTTDAQTEFHITLCRPMRIVLQDKSVEFVEFDAVRDFDQDDVQMRLIFFEVSRLYLKSAPTMETPATERPVRMRARLRMPVENISGMVERAPDPKKA